MQDLNSRHTQINLKCYCFHLLPLSLTVYIFLLSNSSSGPEKSSSISRMLCSFTQGPGWISEAHLWVSLRLQIWRYANVDGRANVDLQVTYLAGTPANQYLF